MECCRELRGGEPRRVVFGVTHFYSSHESRAVLADPDARRDRHHQHHPDDPEPRHAGTPASSKMVVLKLERWIARYLSGPPRARQCRRRGAPLRRGHVHQEPPLALTPDRRSPTKRRPSGWPSSPWGHPVWNVSHASASHHSRPHSGSRRRRTSPASNDPARPSRAPSSSREPALRGAHSGIPRSGRHGTRLAPGPGAQEESVT